MYTVFVTGGIGSGKSVFTSRLAQHGARIFDLDRISHEILEDSSCIADLVEEFGEGILVAGSVNRSELARRAFATPASTMRLNQITHPRILRRLDLLLNGGCSCTGRQKGVNVVEVQLIDHAGDSLALADEIVCISCPREVRKIRAVSRGMSPEDFDLRDSRQIDDGGRERLCTTVIRNEGCLETFLKAADAWWESRLSAHASPSNYSEGEQDEESRRRIRREA